MELVQEKYKQTEVGLIPNEWDVKNYEEVFTFLNTATYSRAELTESDEIKYIHYGDIHTKFHFHLDVNCNYLPSIPYSKFKNFSLLKNGDLIMADASEDYAGIGKSIEVKNLKNTKVISGLHTFLLRSKAGYFVDGYKGYIHTVNAVKKQFDALATGLKVYGVSKNNLKKILIPIPPKSEQTAIATALSDADNWINSLEQLIAKKRLIKQGAMQELLKPKEGWVVKKLGEICEIKKGKGISKSQLNIDGKYKCILYGELFTTYKEVIKTVFSKTNFEESIFSKEQDILFPGSTTTTGIDLAKSSTILESGVLLGGDIIIVRKLNYDYNSIFLTYFLNVIKRNEIAQSTKGITIHHLYGSDLSGIEVEFPEIKEQTRIATILSDMDEEIKALEEKLEKAKKVKLGMMQELLTGRIRLI